MSCIGLTTNSPTSLLDFIRRRVGIGKLVRRRVDWLPPYPFPIFIRILETVKEAAVGFIIAWRVVCAHGEGERRLKYE